MKERYAYLVLVLLSVGLSIVVYFVNLYQIEKNDRLFCAVVSSVTSVPTVPPKNPAADPSRERTWEFFVKFVNLGRSLGCAGMPIIRE